MIGEFNQLDGYEIEALGERYEESKMNEKQSSGYWICDRLHPPSGQSVKVSNSLSKCHVCGLSKQGIDETRNTPHLRENAARDVFNREDSTCTSCGRQKVVRVSN